MSRLEELIHSLCPDGVQYTKLINACKDFIVPMRDRPKIFDGDIPWCRIEDIEGQYFNTSLSGHFVSKKTISEMNLKVFPTGTVICSCSASLGTYAINTKPLVTNQTFIGLVCGEALNNKFLRYYMETQTKLLGMISNAGTIPYVPRKKFEDLVIPLPPFPVQEEIVRILDTFSDVVVELEAEQKARVKQYEYYSNEMLSFDSKSKIVEMLLGDIRSDDIDYLRLGGKEGICKVLASGVDKVINENERPVKLCNYMDVYDNSHITDAIVDDLRNGSVNDNEYERFVLREGQVLLTKDSETKEDIAQSAYVYKDYPDVVCGYHLAVLTPLVKINSKYLNYVLQSYKLRSYFSKMSYGVSRYGLRLKSIEDALVPVPPIEVQEEIVSILDRFDALVNDLKSGLPAEIALRRKQYEYYRDKLLSFEPSE